MSNLLSFNWLLPQNFLPHGHCYLWRPDVLWLHVSSDAVIAASYYAIPVALAYFVHRRRAVLPYWWVPVLFATFIFLCGTTHVLNIWTVWRPDYVVDGLVKLATAVASVSTAVLVFASLPQAIALRTPIELQAEVQKRIAELQAANMRLREEVAARQENEARMRLALEASRAATWSMDYSKAGTEYFDVRSCELAGLDAAQATWPAGTLCNLLHPEDREQMQRALAQTRSMSGPGPVVEYRIVTDRAEVRWLRGAGIMQRNARGEAERFVGVSTDITEQKMAEARAREHGEIIQHQLAEIETLYRSAPIGLTAFDRELRCIRISQRMAEMNGVPISAALGRHLREYIPGELADITESQLRRVLETGEPLMGVENSGETRAGDKRHWLLNYYPWRNTEGQIIGVSVAVQDVTEQKRSEAALAASTHELHQTFNATTTGLTRCSRELRYIAANPAYAAIAGVPLHQIIGQPIVDVMGREGLEKIRPYIERVLAGESVEYETSVPFSTSGMRRLHVAYSPWRETDGSVSGWIGSLTDVTARHEAEEKLKAANRLKDEFLAMLSHELRNPLAPIRNAGELLGHWLGSHPQAKVPLAILQRQTRQLTRLVDDLLDVARISQGQITLKKEIIEIGAVLDQALETVQPLVQEKLHRLTIHKPFAPVYVNGDFARLVQSLGNILHNATKYTERGGEIEVDVKEANAQLTISVRDSGSGIAPELLPAVFDLFVQSRRTMDRSQGGLGIGLTVVKQLIRLHEGSVSAESAGVGRGTTVTVRLPTVRPASAPAAEEAAFSAPSRRILVVDDNKDAADSLAMMLQVHGHDASAVYSALDALATVQRLKPEVVFLDIGLPQMDGYGVAARLRAEYGSACPRLIALTGYGQPEDRARAVAAGFAAHLTKPAGPLEIQQVLETDPAQGATGT